MMLLSIKLVYTQEYSGVIFRLPAGSFNFFYESSLNGIK